MKIVDGEFFARGAEELARDLIGKVLCRDDGGRRLRAVICETECYSGGDDTACHARFGKTLRNAVMWDAGGRLYVYLCYGIHNLLNVTAGRAGFPEAVLIRGVEGHIGPGRVTRFFGITREHNGLDLTMSPQIYIEDGGLRPQITALPRVGIDYADKADRERLWRFAAINRDIFCDKH